MIKKIKKKINEEGIPETILYYVCRLCSKVEAVLIGKYFEKRPVCEQRLVFKNRQMQDFSDNIRAFVEFLVDNGYNEKYQIVLMVSDRKKFSSVNIKNVKFVTAESKHGWNSFLAYYYGATAKYFFYTNNTADLNKYHGKGQIIVNFWHGCGYKGATYSNTAIPKSDTMGRFDYALVPGPVFINTKSAYWNCKTEKILPLGYPRYDWMLRSAESKDKILEKLFGWKESDTKAVIWMPTFRKSSLQGYSESQIELPYELPGIESYSQLEEVDRFCRKNRILLIIKKHPLQIGWAEKREKLTNIRYVTENLLEQKEVQLYQLVGGCDALISDYSSVAVDFLLLDRPLGFVLTDYESYRSTRGFVFEDPLSYMPGEKIYGIQELKSFLEHVRSGEDPYAKARQEVLPEMHERTDHYCRKIAEYFHIEKK